MNRSQAAFTLTAQAMNTGKGLYLWTLTFREKLPIIEARQRWKLASKHLPRETGLNGLRVFELHPGGHGLHIHVIAPKWASVNRVRKYLQPFGFGRINVKFVPGDKGGRYAAKYLTKDRPECLKGVRLWASLGGMRKDGDTHIGEAEVSKCKNIRFSNPYTAEYAGVSERDITLVAHAYGHSTVSAWIRHEIRAEIAMDRLASGFSRWRKLAQNQYAVRRIAEFYGESIEAVRTFLAAGEPASSLSLLQFP